MIQIFLLLLLNGPPYYTSPVDPLKDLADLRAEIQKGRPQAEPWRIKLQIYTSLSELTSISELVNLLAETFPNDPMFLEAKMMFLSQDKRFDEAIALGEKILREYPTYPTVRNNLARVYFLANQPARGLNLMILALEFAPIQLSDWDLLLKNLALATPDPDKMLTSLRAKCAKNPQFKSLKYILIVVLTRFGKYQEAAEILEQNPELANHPDLQLFLAHFQK